MSESASSRGPQMAPLEGPERAVSGYRVKVRCWSSWRAEAWCAARRPSKTSTQRNAYVESMTIYPSRESSLHGTGRSLG